MVFEGYTPWKPFAGHYSIRLYTTLFLLAKIGDGVGYGLAGTSGTTFKPPNRPVNKEKPPAVCRRTTRHR